VGYVADRDGIIPATAEDIKAFRRRWKLQQAELRDYLGVGPFTISRWESGSQNVRHPKMLALALAELDHRFVGYAAGKGRPKKGAA
jgi:predicted transcriptional regulator